MNPAYLQLLAQMGITLTTLVASNQGKDATAIIAAIPAVQAAITAYSNGLTVLGRAHAEAWADDDVRWAEQFAGLDAVLDELEKQMS